MRRKLGLLFALYFCQGLPGGFLAVAVPVILREQGLDLTTIGLASALSLPWVLKVLWAPLVDGHGSPRIGRRKSWLLPAQAGMLVVTLAFIAVRPEQSLWAVAVLFLVLNVFAATQDIAVDGWAVDMLEPHEIGPANSAQVGGFKVGNLVGGGVLLALSAVIGWRGDFAIMAALIAATMVLVAVTPERPTPTVNRPSSTADAAARLWRTIKAQGPGLWLFFVYAKFGETFGGAMIKPMLVDRSWSRELIGTLDGVVGSLATIAGALIAGWLIRRRNWAWALAGCSSLQGLALIALAMVHAATPMSPVQGVPTALVELTCVLAVENLAGGGVGVCIFALAMRRADPSIGASLFTAAQVTYMAGAFLAGPSSGALADSVGYTIPVIAGGVMAVLLGLFAGRFRIHLDPPQGSPT